MSPGTASCLSKMGDQLLASTDMQWHIFFPSSPPYIFRNSMRNDTAVFETQNMLHGPGKGDTPWCQRRLKALSLFLCLFHLLFSQLLHSFTHLWTDQMDLKRLFCSTSTTSLLIELAVLSHETFLMKSHGMSCIYVNSSSPWGKSFLLFYSPD